MRQRLDVTEIVRSHSQPNPQPGNAVVCPHPAVTSQRWWFGRSVVRRARSPPRSGGSALGQATGLFRRGTAVQRVRDVRVLSGFSAAGRHSGRMFDRKGSAGWSS